MTDGLSSAEFDALFQRFADSPTSTAVFRWEALQHYAIPSDEPSLVAFREGTPRPERSVRTSPWLARIASSTVAGKTWTRIRYLEEPLSEYVRWELLAYTESQAAGERILIVRHNVLPKLTDFWLLDGTEPGDRFAILMRYDEAGVPLAFDYRDGDQELEALRTASADGRVRESAVPLNEYVAPRRGGAPGAA